MPRSETWAFIGEGCRPARLPPMVGAVITGVHAIVFSAQVEQGPELPHRRPRTRLGQRRRRLADLRDAAGRVRGASGRRRDLPRAAPDLRRNRRDPGRAACKGVDTARGVRQEIIFTGDAETYKAAKDASDGLEHGSWELDKVAAHALKSADKTFRYVRRTIVDLLDLPQEVANELNEIKPKDVQSMRKSPRRSNQRIPTSSLARPEKHLVKDLHRVLAWHKVSVIMAGSRWERSVSTERCERHAGQRNSLAS